MDGHDMPGARSGRQASRLLSAAAVARSSETALRHALHLLSAERLRARVSDSSGVLSTSPDGNEGEQALVLEV